MDRYNRNEITTSFAQQSDSHIQNNKDSLELIESLIIEADYIYAENVILEYSCPKKCGYSCCNACDKLCCKIPQTFCCVPRCRYKRQYHNEEMISCPYKEGFYNLFNFLYKNSDVCKIHPDNIDFNNAEFDVEINAKKFNIRSANNRLINKDWLICGEHKNNIITTNPCVGSLKITQDNELESEFSDDTHQVKLGNKCFSWIYSPTTTSSIRITYI